MGKREVGELQPFELVVTIIIAEIAASPIENTGLPLLNGIIPILTILVLEVILSYLNLKSMTVRKYLCGTPSILISKGSIIESEMKKQRINMNDLMQLMRIKGYPNILDVEYVIMETNGDISIIPKSQKRPLTPEDLNISTDDEGLPLDLINDGKIIYKNLDAADIDVSWLKGELRKNDIQDVKQVLYASIDTTGNLFIQQKNSDKGNA